jgi:hypothetical protein
VNNFLTDQKKVPGACTFTLVQFDSQGPYEVLQDFVPIVDAKLLTDATYQPRANTPLFDAIGRGLVDCTEKIAKLAQKPDRVLVVIITDGQENCSHEYDKAKIVEAIDKKKADGWQFVFLGVGIDGMADAGAIGILAASTLNTGRSAKSVHMSYCAMSSNVTGYRTAATNDIANQSLGFTKEQREEQEAEGAVSMSKTP